MIMASMRNWLHGEEDDSVKSGGDTVSKTGTEKKAVDPSKRVVVVHCKAGKGRSGTMTCSYLISQCGWTAEDALARFTERRMRPNFGSGVSIPSQLRWISYVDRWTRAGKRYVDREVEIVEVHVWGLRHGVKVSVEGFVDEGKKIRVFHTFSKAERMIVQGDAPGGAGVMDFIGDALSPGADDEEGHENADHEEAAGDADGDATKSKQGSKRSILRNASVKKLAYDAKSKTINPADFASASKSVDTSATNSNLSLPNAAPSSVSRSNTMASNSEPGGMAVIFHPATPVRLPTSDVSVSLERRNRAPASMGLTMVTAVAHVWFNTFFEGRGPEQDSRADDSGVFEIQWDKMDGIKGSSRKGTRAADKISVVWRAVGSEEKATETPGVVVTEPGEGSPVPQMRPADWRGETVEDPSLGRQLGLRTAEPGSEAVSKASSVRSQEVGSSVGSTKDGNDARDSDDESLKGVKSAVPEGADEAQGKSSLGGASTGDGGSRALSEHEKKVEATQGSTSNPEEASGAATSQGELSKMENSGTGSSGATTTSQTPSSIGSQAEKSHTGEEAEKSGDTTHLGFVKRGKKLLPMHTHTHEESSAGGGSGPGSTTDNGDNRDGKGDGPQVMSAHVAK